MHHVTVRALIQIATLLLVALPLQAAAPQERLFLADKFIWSGEGGVRAVRIFGKFNSRELMVENLALDHEVGRLSDLRNSSALRVWTLGDILVSMELNANGFVGSWTVAGPRPLIDAYAARLTKANETRTIFYDFGLSELSPYFSAD